MGPNGDVTYRLMPTPSRGNERFSIDERTGVIRVLQPLSAYQQSVYELVVVASDRGAQPMESTTFVTVRLSSNNDDRYSSIRVLFLSPDGRPIVSEAAPLGELVARLSVSDGYESAGDYQVAEMMLEGDGGSFSVKRTDTNVFTMAVAKPLDREVNLVFLVSKFVCKLP